MKAIRRFLRRHAPECARRQVALARRALADRISGDRARMTKTGPREELPDFAVRVEVTQAVRATEHAQGKIENLRLAAQRLSGRTIAPGDIFSFWALVGPPSRGNGFSVGRAIVEDRLVAEVGGGLCQISGLAYELGLRGGLTVLERFPHSRDIYTEEARFTALGLDATVVHGFKDLRLRNDLGAPVAFEFTVDETEIRGALLCPQALAPWRLEIERSDEGPRLRRAEVRRVDARGAAQAVSSTLYTVDVA